MKTTGSQKNLNGKGVTHAYALLVKAEAAEKLLDAARAQWRVFKLEHKQARKAFKQAKKAAKLARKEAKAAVKVLKDQGIKLQKAPKPATRRKPAPSRAQKSLKHSVIKRNGHSTSVVQPTTPDATTPQPGTVHLQA